MKSLIAVSLLLFSVSCVSTKYNIYKNPNDFQKVQAGTKYTVFDKKDRKVFLDVTSVEKDSIRGTRKNQPFAIAKSDIKEVKKNKTGATAAIIGGTAGTFLLTYLFVDAVTNSGKGFGETDGKK